MKKQIDDEIMYSLQINENEIDELWDTIPYEFIEKWFNITSARIALDNKDDEYSQIIDEICKSCIKKQRVSIKQFKCVLNYRVSKLRQNALKYKYKVGNVK